MLQFAFDIRECIGLHLLQLYICKDAFTLNRLDNVDDTDHYKLFRKKFHTQAGIDGDQEWWPIHCSCNQQINRRWLYGILFGPSISLGPTLVFKGCLCITHTIITPMMTDVGIKFLDLEIIRNWVDAWTNWCRLKPSVCERWTLMTYLIFSSWSCRSGTLSIYTRIFEIRYEFKVNMSKCDLIVPSHNLHVLQTK